MWKTFHHMRANKFNLQCILGLIICFWTNFDFGIISGIFYNFVYWNSIECNNTIRSITEHASDLDWAFVESQVDCGFLCLIGARWSLTLKTRFGSFIKALAYWSSVMHIRIRKLSLTVWWDESDLVSYSLQ